MPEYLEHDVVIVGGGGAGLRAAIAIAEEKPDVRIALVSKVYPMRSHTVSAEGGAAAVIKDNDSLEDHIYDTISGADWLADQDAVEMFVNEAPKEMILLEHWGCPWSREPKGHVAVRPFGGMKIERTWFAADKTGFHMLHALFQTTLKYGQIHRYDEHFATKLLVDGGRCQGVVAVDLKTGVVKAIAGKATILCTGGAGQVFPFTTNGAIKTGDGMAIAYQAGVPLKDMEFVQYHPTGLPGTGILITEASRGEGGILLNKDGHRYLQDYDLGQPLDVNDPNHPVKRTMELGPRDRLSQAFYWEREAGRTVKQEKFDNIDAVLLDLRHLGEEKINERLPFVRELARNYVSVDPVHEPIPVRPVIHYVMGGVDTNIDGATVLPGLYAAGEVACVNINGANRLGSNSLTELLVFGARAGRHAGGFIAEHSELNRTACQQQAKDYQQYLRDTLLTDGEGESLAAIRTEMKKAMEDGCGIYRDEPRMQATCDKLAELKQRYKHIKLRDRSGAFNTELMYAFELRCMLDVAEALAHSALARKESRGAHQRLDFKQRDDAQCLKHSMAYRNDDAPPRIDYKDVVITRWPPGARTYGADSGLKSKAKT